jgi:hypothetical protein
MGLFSDPRLLGDDSFSLLLADRSSIVESKRIVKDKKNCSLATTAYVLSIV